MKKIIAVLISLGLLASFSGCGNSESQTELITAEETYAAVLSDSDDTVEAASNETQAAAPAEETEITSEAAPEIQ